jgi:hypothetical protein
VDVAADADEQDASQRVHGPAAVSDTAKATRPLHVFFDVDYTILGSYDGSLRPHTVEVFERLRDDGHDVYVWSGEGERWSVLRTHGLEHLVSGVYGKPLHDYRQRLDEFKVPVVPDFVIDDYSGIVRCFGGIQVPEYFGSWSRGPAGDGDTVLLEVYDAIRVLAEGRTPEHSRYYLGEGAGPSIPSR